MQPTTKFKDFIKVIEEDYGQEIMPDVARDQMGLKTEYPSQPSSVQDIFNKQNRTDVAPENIPYPLNEFDDVVANAFVSIQNLEELLKIANTNSVIKNKKPLDNLSKEIIELKGKLVDISRKVSKIK
jgi:hypothetical protein|tara:strand:- start:207 stop:587 length:381 start_codon:yes stop_codon:yes gene_type:complete